MTEIFLFDSIPLRTKKVRILKVKKDEAEIDKKENDLKVKMKIVRNTAYVIIFGAMVTAFALVFSTALLDYISSIIGEVGLIVNLIITAILLVVFILLLIKAQNKKKEWEDLAEQEGIKF